MNTSTSTYTIEIQQDEQSKEYFLEFPEEVIQATDWKIGDTIEWVDNKDGSFSLIQKEEKMAKYYSTKTYGHDLGLSAAFRQWRAESHCKYIHGYALAVRFEFEAEELDVRNWVVDFGGLKGLKGLLEDTFDHKLLVAQDDPEIEWFREAHKKGVADIVEVEACGCEKFAELIYEVAECWLKEAGFSPRCRLVSVEVREHGANSAIFKGR